MGPIQGANPTLRRSESFTSRTAVSASSAARALRAKAAVGSGLVKVDGPAVGSLAAVEPEAAARSPGKGTSGRVASGGRGEWGPSVVSAAIPSASGSRATRPPRAQGRLTLQVWERGWHRNGPRVQIVKVRELLRDLRDHAVVCVRREGRDARLRLPARQARLPLAADEGAVGQRRPSTSQKIATRAPPRGRPGAGERCKARWAANKALSLLDLVRRNLPLPTGLIHIHQRADLDKVHTALRQLAVGRSDEARRAGQLVGPTPQSAHRPQWRPAARSDLQFLAIAVPNGLPQIEALERPPQHPLAAGAQCQRGLACRTERRSAARAPPVRQSPQQVVLGSGRDAYAGGANKHTNTHNARSLALGDST